MFFVCVLNDCGFLGYLGYDYLGNEFNGIFDDFFSMVDFVIGFCSFLVVFN